MRQDSRIELNIASNPESLPEVRTAAERMARQEGFGDADAHRLVLAIDEALANVIKHGYEGRPDQPITITLEKAKSAEGRVGIAVTVRDQGRQVDPKTIKGRPLDDIRPGGLGVHIIRTVMDEYSYSCPEEGGMMLRMIKYISDDGTQPAPRDLPANDRVAKK
jgi:anti-sigma regulatory factor (Ser/Thr protein kinase)